MNDSQVYQYDIPPDLSITAQDVIDQAHVVWQQLRKPGTLAHEQALKEGVDPNALPSELEDALKIGESGAGFDPTMISIVVATVGGALVPKLPKMIDDVWKFVILPQLRHHFGDKSLVDTTPDRKK